MKKQTHQTGRRRGPYKEAPDRRSKRSIRFSEVEWSTVVKTAETLQMTPAAYVRKAALRPLTAPRLKVPEAGALRVQLQRIGNNLNQLTRLAHTDGRLDPEAIADALDDLKTAVKNLSDQ